MSDIWYYAQGDDPVGPLSLADLKAILSRVSDAKNVLVWRRGFAEWKKAENVTELAAVVIRPPPIKPNRSAADLTSNRELPTKSAPQPARSVVLSTEPQPIRDEVQNPTATSQYKWGLTNQNKIILAVVLSALMLIVWQV